MPRSFHVMARVASRDMMRSHQSGMKHEPWTVWILTLIAWGVALAAPPGPRPTQTGTDRKDWIQLFNGRDLSGWVAKVKGFELGQNVRDTFRVENGVLRVAYDGYEQFEGRFAHLFHRQRFSHYIIAAEYRFVGDQVPGGPTWAVRNNGLMLHSQSPESMGRNQDFPISIEVQLLGGGPSGERSTANVCTPGTEIFMSGAMVRRHCTNSVSDTYRGDRWVRVEVEVRGAEHVRHSVEGRTVLEYDRLHIGGGNVSGFDPAIKIDGASLGEGYIAIQGESHPTEFRKIELLNLSGCMNPRDPSYRPHFIRRDDSACKLPG
jgi:hypothetical protein